MLSREKKNLAAEEEPYRKKRKGLFDGCNLCSVYYAEGIKPHCFCWKSVYIFGQRLLCRPAADSENWWSEIGLRFFLFFALRNQWMPSLSNLGWWRPCWHGHRWCVVCMTPLPRPVCIKVAWWYICIFGQRKAWKSEKLYRVVASEISNIGVLFKKGMREKKEQSRGSETVF